MIWSTSFLVPLASLKLLFETPWTMFCFPCFLQHHFAIPLNHSETQFWLLINTSGWGLSAVLSFPDSVISVTFFFGNLSRKRALYISVLFQEISFIFIYFIFMKYIRKFHQKILEKLNGSETSPRISWETLPWNSFANCSWILLGNTTRNSFGDITRNFVKACSRDSFGKFRRFFQEFL